MRILLGLLLVIGTAGTAFGWSDDPAGTRDNPWIIEHPNGSKTKIYQQDYDTLGEWDPRYGRWVQPRGSNETLEQFQKIIELIRQSN